MHNWHDQKRQILKRAEGSTLSNPFRALNLFIYSLPFNCCSQWGGHFRKAGDLFIHLFISAILHKSSVAPQNRCEKKQGFFGGGEFISSGGAFFATVAFADASFLTAITLAATAILAACAGASTTTFALTTTAEVPCCNSRCDDHDEPTGPHRYFCTITNDRPS